MIIVNYPYSLDDIDRIEDEFKQVDLENEEVEIIEESIHFPSLYAVIGIKQ